MTSEAADATPASDRGRSCAFCGAVGNLTKEHVFGNWMNRIGLDYEQARYHAGPLNRLSKDLGTGPMFSRTVRNICGSCNNGWMNDLEQVAQQSLPPLILGEPGRIDPALQGALALWAQKTALVGMLVSSESERIDGYGLDQSEYRALYKIRDQDHPLPASTLWIGRYTGQTRQAVAAVMPFVVRLDGLPQPTHPHGYAATVAVGQLIIHSTRFTTPGMDLDLDTRQGMSRLWPPAGPIDWPQGLVVDDTDLVGLVAGKDLQVRHPDMRLVPWGPAADLPRSVDLGSAIGLPTLCGKHIIYYPPSLIAEARRGRVHAFIAACECDVAYLIHIEADAAHFRASGPAELIGEMYENLPGAEFLIENSIGVFVCKRLIE